VNFTDFGAGRILAKHRLRWLPETGDLQGDVIDHANADAEADLHIRLHQSDAHLLRAIEDALARITHDRFGVCETCGSPISKARLEAAVDASVPRLQGARAVSRLRTMSYQIRIGFRPAAPTSPSLPSPP
jgi:hypothetical protein